MAFTFASPERHWRHPATKQPAALLVGAQRRLAPLVRPQAAMGNSTQGVLSRHDAELYDPALL